MEIKVHVQETTEKTTTEKIIVAPGVEVCRVTVVRRAVTKGIYGGTKVGAPQTTVTEHVQHSHKSEDKYYGAFVVVEPELVEKLRMTGWFADSKEAELISRTPFTRITEGKDKPYVIVRMDNADNRIYDLEGGRLPVAVYFDYGVGSGAVNDYSFDLPKLLEHLQKREDVTLRKGRWGDSPIQSIPHYNAGDTSGHHHIAFLWHPTVEVFRQYIELSAKGDRFYRHHVAHTLMGNDEFRIPPREPRENDEDE